MARSSRLLDLLQTLRRHRQPVSGAALAAEHSISLRTLYRDIATLQAQGADIEGEPGLGYILKPGFMLPPLMFSDDELEALVIGSRWVAENADPRLSRAGQNAIAKIAGVLPANLRQLIDESTLLVATLDKPPPDVVDIAELRRAVRSERKLRIVYCDGAGATTDRVIWPFGLGYLDRVRMVMAWCELRQDIRNFRTDRIASLTDTNERYPRRRAVLLREWKQREETAECALADAATAIF